MKNENKTQEVEKLKGRAMLRWDGKKPLERVDYYPAQEKEVYGDKKSKEFNKLFWGDNLQVLGHLMKEYRGKIDLIYIDPPFDSKADYVKSVKIRGEKVEGQQKGLLEEKQYGDIWEKDEYLQFMYERLIVMRELLTESGSIFLHCDWHKSAYLRILLDEIFGEDNFVNEIIWSYGSPSGGRAASEKPVKNHDNIFQYAKNYSLRKKNRIYIPYSEKYIKEWFKYKDEDGRMYRRRMRDRDEAGDAVWVKQYLDESKGMPLSTTWLDLLQVYADPRAYKDNTASEITAYPTQKPEELAARIISIASDVGDTVMDCFVGSGTTCVAAQKLGRRWIGCDINIGAIQTTMKRLNQVIGAQLKGKTDKGAWLLDANEIPEAEKKTGFGFKVLNVNDYDIFKNELEAKEIIMEMYGVEKARMSYFDGVLDNRFVKVMPLNRVLSKKDMDVVIKGIKDNLDSFEVKTKSRHGEAVYEQGVTVFCSGLEMDALDYLKKKNDTGVEVDVRDILLDKQGVIFKQKPEAEISVKPKGGKVTVKIDDFISPILMRKLEIENDKTLKKEAKAKVEDFRQIIDSVAIDVDYDGKLFNAEIIDVPAKNELIKAEYEIEYAKKGKQTLAIKIVDVLGEEYFETFEATV